MKTLTLLPRQFVMTLLSMFCVYKIAFSAEVKIALQFDKQSYKVGDQVAFTVTYKNASTEVVRILAAERYYVSSLLYFIRQRDDNPASVVPRAGESTFDTEDLLQYMVILQPGDSIARNYTARLAASVPSDFEQRGKGVFLIYRDSAIQLPGFGKYVVTSSYDETGGDELNDYVTREPELWTGKAQSPPVYVTFKPR